jgi:hypothetical protein
VALIVLYEDRDRTLSTDRLGSDGQDQKRGLESVFHFVAIAEDGGTKKRGKVSPGTEHTAIWPFGFVSLYTIVSLREASLQEFAGSMPATGGSLPPPDPC